MEVGSLVLAVVFALVPLNAVATQPAGAATGPVVFVCERGVAKSVVAATLFNQIAAARGLTIRAVSRGTEPDAAMPERIRNGLEAEGMTVNGSFAPTRLTPGDFAAASHVVVFDVAMPAREKVERWDGLPAFSDGYAAASAAIRMRVEALVGRLTAKDKE